MPAKSRTKAQAASLVLLKVLTAQFAALMASFNSSLVLLKASADCVNCRGNWLSFNSSLVLLKVGSAVADGDISALPCFNSSLVLLKVEYMLFKADQERKKVSIPAWFY